MLVLLTFSWSLLSISSCTSSKMDKQQPYPIIAAVNAYSFSDLLSARDSRNNEQVYTLFNLLDWCADHQVKALDPTAYFFPSYPEVPSDEYLEKFKNRAAELGIALSGTGIRNNFASPDPEVRSEGVLLAKDWIVAASKIGAPAVRLFAGPVPEGYTWEEAAGWMIDCYKDCAEFGEQYGVKIGIQNHGDMLQTAEQCIYVMKALDPDWAGLIVDIGSFKTEDPYSDISRVLPYAINFQVKESVYGTGSEIRTDFTRLVKIVKEGGYHGYFPVETLLVQGTPYDPFARVTEMLDELESAMEEVY